MKFYTTVLRKSSNYWVALCLENGLAGQGETKEDAVLKLKEAVDSFYEAQSDDPTIYDAPLSIRELHEFLTVEGLETRPLELRAVYA